MRNKGAAKSVKVQQAHVVTLVICGFATGVLFGYIYSKQSAVYSGTAVYHLPADDHTAAPPAHPHKQPTAASPPPKEHAVVASKGGTDGIPTKGTTVHTLYTSNGSPYQNFQGRIMYGTYLAAQKSPGGENLVGFTRILHRGSNDEVVGEIPTFRADPLQPLCDTWCEFPVKDRANAVMQWINATRRDPSMVKGAWLFMLETDYVWVKPVQVPGDAGDPSVRGLAFHYDYINPDYPGVSDILREMAPGVDVSKVPASGPAPVLMRYADLAAAAPHWEVFSAWIESHKHAKDRLGWVREMYAWDLAVAVAGLSFDTATPPESTLLAQPPHDRQLGKACMYHYTWGAIYKDTNGSEIWKFDKRFYTAATDALKVPLLPLPPAWREGIRLQDGLPVTRELNDAMRDMLVHMNAAIEKLPDLRQKTRV